MSIRSIIRPMLGAVIAITMTATPASAATSDRAAVLDFQAGTPIDGAWSKLSRTDDGVRSVVHTTVEADHAFTMWYVIFNNPAACTADCGEDDIFIDPQAPVFDFDQINAAQISVVYAGGGVANEAGRLQLHGGLAEGTAPSGPAQIVIGREDDGAFVPSPVTGLLDAATAEIHIVLQSHGPAHDDPELLEQQTTQFMGACNGGCDDVQAAIHMP